MASILVEEARTFASILAKRLLPVKVTDSLRKAHQKRKRQKLRDIVQPPAISRDRLAEDLRSLGLARGRDVLIHSALSTLGPLEKGAETLVGAIMDVAGPEATLLAPAYPMPGTMHEWMLMPEPFNVEETRSRMGAFTEYLRKLPGARRSAHPTHSMAAYGPRAQEYTAEHHLGGTPTDSRSPFHKHVENDGQIVCIGTGVGKITSYHVIEDCMAAFPIAVYLDKPESKVVEFGDGRRVTVTTRVNNPALSPWRVDNFKPKEMEIYRRLISEGVAREGKVGLAVSHIMDAKDLFAATRRWAEQGITIYHLPALSSGVRLVGKAFGKSRAY